jgi:hypothetical protein
MQQQTEPSASSSPAELRLVLRRPEDVWALDEQQLGWLALSLRGDTRFTIWDMLRDIAAERAQLWAIEDDAGEATALLVTRLVQYARCSSLEIHLCGGRSIERWLGMLPELEQHARNLGCRFVELCGRRGWERILPEYAFRGVALAKELV